MRDGAERGVHERWMALALVEAKAAAAEGEVPVGAVVVRGTEVLGRAHNQTETLRDPTAHAEMIAITQAAAAMDAPRLAGATLYATLEPCAMCAGAAVLARVDAIVWGADDPKAGACGSVLRVAGEPRLNHRPVLTGGVFAEQAGAVLREFFRARRGPANGDGTGGRARGAATRRRPPG